MSDVPLNWDNGQEATGDERRTIFCNLKTAMEFQGLAFIEETMKSTEEKVSKNKEMYMDFIKAGERLTMDGVEIKTEADLEIALIKRHTTYNE